MAARQSIHLELAILLHPSLLRGRTRLGQRVQELCNKQPEVLEQAFDDGTLKCPRLLLAAEEAQPPLQDHRLKTVTWRVASAAGLAVPRHVLLCFTPQEFVAATNSDGLSSVLQAVDDLYPGWRIYMLTYEADSKCMPPAAAAAAAAGGGAAAADAMRGHLWQLVAELAVWRPDVAFHNAASLQEAADHVYRLSRAVAEAAGGYKRTSLSSYLSVLPLTAAAQEKRQRLEALLARYGGSSDARTSSAAALMRAQLAIEGVTAEAAYAVGAEFGSLQQLLEEVDGNAAAARATIANLPLPASASVVGQAAAEKIVIAALGRAI